jgi:UDP-N-acetylmuramoyl-tripeptide--D-alanyl-D-alanine ligase
MQRDHKERYKLDIPLIIVDDILEGLKEIIGYVRDKVNVPVIGITGSTGKTTTRMMTVSILSQFGKVLTSDKNINTLWGISELLMTLSDEKYVVLEIGMDCKGEIKMQCEGLKPNIGGILNVGYVHGEKCWWY